MYAYMHQTQSSSSKEVICSIYSFRNQKSGYIHLLVDDNERLNKDVFEQFEQGLIKMAKDMLDRENPIVLANHRYQKFAV